MLALPRSRPQTVSGDVCFVRMTVCSDDNEFGDELWRLLDEWERELRREIERTVRATLGESFEVRALAFGRGSIEIFVLVGTAYYAISRYKNFVESIELMVGQLKKVVQHWLRNRTPGPVHVSASWSPAEGLAPASVKSPKPPMAWDGLVLWYLIVSHAAMLGVLLWLGAEALRP